MRCVIQRVSSASVVVDGEPTGSIDTGLLVLLGIGPEDTEVEAVWMVNKLVNLRIFADEAGQMNLSLLDVEGGALVVSQFTLYGDCRRGRRPSFKGAAHPSLAEPLYERFCELLEERKVFVQRGIFAADMKVSLVNDGPVTLVLDRGAGSS